MSSTAADGNAGPFLWKFANVEFDERTGELRVGGELVELAGAPVRVLQALLAQPNKTLARDELIESVWKRPADLVSKNVVSNAVARLRRALVDDSQRLVATAQGGGYRLDAIVERTQLPPLVSLDRFLKAGQAAPHRQNWKLRQRIDTSPSSEVWLVAHEKTNEQRVFKFAGDGFQLASLRREVTISRLLYAALGKRDDFLRVLDWNLEQPPYFIETEFGGDNLARWFERAGGAAAVTVEQRIQIAIALADTVATAHSVGVLHKDLKPANILVHTAEGGRLQVRVVDFGSGRLLEPEQLDAFLISQVPLPDADHTGTPFYVAPEVLVGEVASTASDIYALGVILYQLVIGDFRRPIASGWEADVTDELLREDILAATQGDPAKRLKSASELGERLKGLVERHRVKSEANHARQEVEGAKLALQRARQRRPWLAAIFVSLILGLGLSLFFFARANHERNLTKEQYRQVQALNKFLNDGLLKGANPVHGGDSNITLKEAVTKAASSITDDLKDAPVVQARMHLTVAEDFQSLWDYQAAAAHYKEAISLFQSSEGAISDDALQSSFEFVQSLAESYHLEEAEIFLKQSIADFERANTPSAMTIFRRYQSSAIVAQLTFDFPTAIKDIDTAVAASEKVPDLDPSEVDTLRGTHGLALATEGKFDAGITELEKLVARLKARQQPADWLLAKSMLKLGQAYDQSNREDKALEVAQEVYQYDAKLFGSESALTHEAHLFLGDVFVYSKRFPEAESYLGSEYAYYSKTLGPTSHQAVAAALLLNTALGLQGKIEAAMNAIDNDFEKYVALGQMPLNPNVQQALFDEAIFGIQLDRVDVTMKVLPWLHLDDLTKANWMQKDESAAMLGYLSGEVALFQKHYPEAITQLDKAIPDLEKFTKAENLPEGMAPLDATYAANAKKALAVAKEHLVVSSK